MAPTPRNSDQPPLGARLIESGSYRGLHSLGNDFLIEHRPHERPQGWFLVYQRAANGDWRSLATERARRVPDSYWASSSDPTQTQTPPPSRRIASNPSSRIPTPRRIPVTLPEEPIEPQTPLIPSPELAPSRSQSPESIGEIEPHLQPEPEPTPVMTQPTPKEIAIGRPPVFDGDRAKAALFIKSCKVYLQINKAIYDADDKKIAFILSFMTEGTATTWASQAMDRALSKEGYKDLAEFEEQFNMKFASIDNKEMSYLKLVT